MSREWALAQESGEHHEKLKALLDEELALQELERHRIAAEGEAKEP